jgi:hypothetical protein
MSEKPRSKLSYTKFLLILVFVVFPILFFAVYVRTGSNSKYGAGSPNYSDGSGDGYFPPGVSGYRNESPTIGIDLSDEYIRMA